MFNFSLSIVSVYLTLLKKNDDQIKLNLIIRVIEGHNISECSKYFTSGVFKKKNHKMSGTRLHYCSVDYQQLLSYVFEEINNEF